MARQFFQAGKASQTIALTISAYDMTYSDIIYGKEKNGRYVCESRVQKMLEKEYSKLLLRLNEARGKNTNFFSFADTVATSKDKKPNDNFVEQLTMNAEAAINTLDSMGVGDRNRVAVGGHSSC